MVCGDRSLLLSQVYLGLPPHSFAPRRKPLVRRGPSRPDRDHEYWVTQPGQATLTHALAAAEAAKNKPPGPAHVNM